MAIQTIKKSPAAFDLKGSLFTLTVMHLFLDDLDLVSDQLAIKVEQAPAFFQNAPVVIDLQNYQRSGEQIDFALLVGLLRGYGFVPVGVVGGTHEEKEMAKAMELAVLAAGRGENQNRPPVVADKIETKPELVSENIPLENKLVTQPVRSGQRVIALNGDLIVLSHVSSGAELLSTGNIHVYGSLRGRALAGVKGDTSARIFCRNIDAELVSIAGHYKVNEDLVESVRGQSVQVYLSEKKLKVERL